MFAGLTAFLAKKTSPFAIVFVTFMHIMVQCYLCHLMPMDAKSANLMEIASEVLIHYTFLSFVFAEMQFSPVSKYNAGWVTVVLISLLVSMHVIYMCYELTL